MQVELTSWEQVYRRCREVAAKIFNSGFKPDIVVAIARGGFVPARILCDFLDVYDLACIKVEHYKAGARKTSAARVVFPLNADICGRRVLLMDDVNDTGDTLKIARPYLEAQKPAKLRVAVLDHKDGSGFQADYFGRRVRDWHWITYPWAAIEDLSAFVKKMDTLPGSLEDLGKALERNHGVRPEEATLRDVAQHLGIDSR